MEQTGSDLACALVGAGMVAATHVAAARDADGVALRGVAARDPDRTRAFAERMGGLAVYDDVAAIAADPQIAFVLVTTPPDARAQVIEPLAEAGKHVLVEKPVARDTAEASAVVETCAAAGVTLGIVFQHRMRAASQAAAGLIGAGHLGALVAAEVAVPWWREQSYYDAPGRGTYARDGGGVLISQAIHTLDLMLSLTGPVAEVQALSATTRAHAMEAEDFVAGGLVFEGGAPGALMATTAAFPGRGEAIVLHHDAASLTLAGGSLRVDWRDGRVEEHGAAGGGSGGGADPMAFTHAWHSAVIADFAAALRAGRPPVCPGSEALRVHRLIDALVASARTGRRTQV